jgi:hypothetical protein
MHFVKTMSNRISIYKFLAQLEVVTSGKTWVKVRGLMGRSPFTQPVVE